jgi:NADH:ubiquinone oxidoreductase subunit E
MKQLQTHIVAAGRGDTVELDGVFCMGKCNSGVSLTVDGVYHSVRIENVKEFFEKEIMKNYGLS